MGNLSKPYRVTQPYPLLYVRGWASHYCKNLYLYFLFSTAFQITLHTVVDCSKTRSFIFVHSDCMVFCYKISHITAFRDRSLKLSGIIWGVTRAEMMLSSSFCVQILLGG